MKRLIAAFSVTALLVGAGLAGTVAARPFPDLITLPGATSAEGIATGIGSSFFAGDLFKGDIYLGDLRSGTASLFIDAPDGRMALGLKVDVHDNLLFVAGGFTGQAYVYDARTGADVAVLQLANPALGTAINDVIVARRRGVVHRILPPEPVSRADRCRWVDRRPVNGGRQRPGRPLVGRLQYERHRRHSERRDLDRRSLRGRGPLHG